MGALLRVIAETHYDNDYLQELLDPSVDVVLCLPGDYPGTVDIIADERDMGVVETILDLEDIRYGSRGEANDNI